MKVLDLQCAHQHVFEGWFGSEEDFASQLERGLVSCPLCGDQHIEKKLSAPRLNLRSGKETAGPTSQAAVAMSNHPAHAELVQLQARMLKAMREIVASTEDVGDKFADEARRIHYGEAPERGIRGQTTDAEREALHDEGIEVVAIPVPRALKGPVQ